MSELTDIDDIDEFLKHFGIKGMHWGVRHTKEELESKASEHEALSKAHADRANQFKAEDDDLLKNGLQSKAFKRVYGEDAHKQSEWQFYGKNGQSRAQALEQTHNNLRLAHNQYARSSNKHAAKAVKLRAQAAAMEHSLPTEDSIEHHGVKGMHWGVRKDNPTSSEIHDARSRQFQRRKAYGEAKKSGDSAAIESAKKDFNTSQDRAMAAHLTKGEKVATVLLSTVFASSVATVGSNVGANLTAKSLVGHMLLDNNIGPFAIARAGHQAKKLSSG